MPSRTDPNYYQRRAEEELETARGSVLPEARRAHFLLAGYYFDLAYNRESAAAGNPPPPGNPAGAHPLQSTHPLQANGDLSWLHRNSPTPSPS
jgi:hypothetical protein